MLTKALTDRGVSWPVQALIGALALATLGPWVWEFEGQLPLSLQSLLVCWVPLMLGWRAGLAAVLLYLAAGVAGLPVFAAHRSGMSVIAGPTGGYLLGFPFVAVVLGGLSERLSEQPLRVRYAAIGAGLIVGHALILAFGIPWQARFDPSLDAMGLAQSLIRPAALKSALGLLLSIPVMRGVRGRT